MPVYSLHLAVSIRETSKLRHKDFDFFAECIVQYVFVKRKLEFRLVSVVVNGMARENAVKMYRQVIG